MRELTIEEIHEITLNILKKIDEVAIELNLKYYLAYGSLIGAVRHHGFIPWDDDLDIMMLREDYEKLITYFMEHEKELYPYKIFSNRNNKDYPHMIARVCNVDYPIEVENEIPCGMGVFVDIYPIDGMGNDKAAWQRMMKKRQQLIAGSYYATRKHFEIPKKRYRAFDKYLLYLFAKWKGKNYFLDRLEQYKNRFSLDASRYAGCIVWEQEMFEKEYFLETERLPFEGMLVMVPKQYDRLLRISYGDYMKLPPVEEQQPQHNYKAYQK